MTLSEDQVVRYSRHILLSALGGKGQERLLATGVTLTGQGAAQAVAAAYLAASGLKVSAKGRPVAPEETGFLLAADDVGRPLEAMMRAALLDANPDALGQPSEVGALGELPAGFSGTGPWVALGWSGNRGGLVYRGRDGCAACFERTAGALSNGPAGASAVLLGALGALAFERLALGLSQPLGGLWLSETGEVEPMDLDRCASHGQTGR